MSSSNRPVSTPLPIIAGSPALVQLLWIVGCAAATAVSARFEIPHEPVPYTLQTLVVLLAGAFLGSRNGALSQVTYLAAGALGLPVFAGGAFGPHVLIGPTGGYLFAFPVAAGIIGYLIRLQPGLAWSFASMAVGLLTVFVSGTLFLFAFYLHNLPEAIGAGFLTFSWWDLIKLFAAAMVYHEAAKRRGRSV